jgi:hypothetical protein
LGLWKERDECPGQGDGGREHDGGCECDSAGGKTDGDGECGRGDGECSGAESGGYEGVGVGVGVGGIDRGGGDADGGSGSRCCGGFGRCFRSVFVSGLEGKSDFLCVFFGGISLRSILAEGRYPGFDH